MIILSLGATRQPPRRVSAVLYWGSGRGQAAAALLSPAEVSSGAWAARSRAPPPDQRQSTPAGPGHSKHGSRTNQNTIFDATIASLYLMLILIRVIEWDWDLLQTL